MMTQTPATLAWTCVCQKAVALAAAWAEFKLALDDYALIARRGETPFSEVSDPAKEPSDG